MKKYIFLTMMFVTMVLPLIVSCGSSDDENASSPETPNLSLTKRLVKVTNEYTNSKYIYDYIYDDQGRVVQIQKTIYYDDNKKNTDRIYTYSYDDNKIIESIYSGSTKYWQKTYTLESGRIIKIYDSDTKATSNFNYQNGNLILETLITSKGEPSKIINYNWNDDNLLVINYNNGNTNTFEYTNYICPQGFFHFTNSEIDREFGGMSIYFGKTMKYLPSKRNWGRVEDWYDWTIKDGLPIKMHFSISGDKASTYVFEWE